MQELYKHKNMGITLTLAKWIELVEDYNDNYLDDGEEAMTVEDLIKEGTLIKVKQFIS